MKRDRVLVVAPHPDDAELGCGATIAKWAEEGSNVSILMLSDRGEPEWMNEAQKAAEILRGEWHGPDSHIGVSSLHHTVFHMESQRQGLLRALEQWRRDFKPDVVFCPAMGDSHQDHATALNECRRAFKGVTLLGYELVRSNPNFRPQFYVPVSGEHLDRKIEAVWCYLTQQNKWYCQQSCIRGQALMRGAAIDIETAEAFSVEWIVG